MSAKSLPISPLLRSISTVKTNPTLRGQSGRFARSAKGHVAIDQPPCTSELGNVDLGVQGYRQNQPERLCSSLLCARSVARGRTDVRASSRDFPSSFPVATASTTQNRGLSPGCHSTRARNASVTNVHPFEVADSTVAIASSISKYEKGSAGMNSFPAIRIASIVPFPPICMVCTIHCHSDVAYLER